MKRLIIFFMLIGMLMIIQNITVIAQDGAGVTAPVAAFPIVLIIPYIIGIVCHWLKKWTKDGHGATLWAWLVQDIGWTITSLIVGLTAVYTVYSSNPAALVGDNLGSWIIVMTTAMAADTLNNATPPGKLG